MKKETAREFIKKTESLVHPQDVTAISFLGDFNRYIPKRSQDKLMKKGSQKIPYMGFIVDPYCLFLAYDVTDPEAAQAMLPEGFDLQKTSLFAGEEEKFTAIVSAFTARTSAFIGSRLEFYLIARDRETDLVSWIIIGYETNTNSHDPKNGFGGYTGDPAVFTTTPDGELLVDYKKKNGSDVFKVCADINRGEFNQLNESLWVEGNLSIDYGGLLKDDSSATFGMVFDPHLMDRALKIPLNEISIEANTYFGSIIDGDKPFSAAVFPYSQHYVIKQDLERNEVTNQKELESQLQIFLQKTSYKTMSGEDLKRPLFRGFILSSLINAGLIAYLLIRVFS